MSWVTDSVLARRPWLANPGLFSYGFTEANDDEGAASAGRSTQVAKRLAEAYRRAVADDPRRDGPSDMWTEIKAGFQQELARLAAAAARDAAPRAPAPVPGAVPGTGAVPPRVVPPGVVPPGAADELAAYLRRLPRQAAGHGFLQGQASFNHLVAHPEEQYQRALWLMDHLVGMAEWAGVLDVRCPEQGGYAAVPAGASAGELREEIEAKTGLVLGLPAVFEGLFVLEPRARPVHLRALSAAYALWEAASFARQYLGTEISRLRVAEIGAGMGYTAFVAHQLGVAEHVIYDLPEVNLAQGYFLLMVLPPSAVSLYGEAPVGPAGAPHVWVLPSFMAYEAAHGPFDVTVNVDSLPEIAPQVASRYLAHFGEASRLFLSINQEARAPQTAAQRQSVVRELAGAAGLRPLLRYPNWLRPGYVDELWACGPWAAAGRTGERS
ncbi:MAG: hypothetical protein ACP5VR_01790 [Acidimicrobiales bacterium]